VKAALTSSASFFSSGDTACTVEADSFASMRTQPLAANHNSIVKHRGQWAAKLLVKTFPLEKVDEIVPSLILCSQLRSGPQRRTVSSVHARRSAALLILCCRIFADLLAASDLASRTGAARQRHSGARPALSRRWCVSWARERMRLVHLLPYPQRRGVLVAGGRPSAACAACVDQVFVPGASRKKFSRLP
jgi:hypothetical protein